MSEIYGKLWISQFGDCNGGAYETWQKGLSKFSAQQIGNGVRRCLDRESPFPPNLIEFRALCELDDGGKLRQNGPVLGSPAITYQDPYAGMGETEKAAHVENQRVKIRAALSPDVMVPNKELYERLRREQLKLPARVQTLQA